MKEFLKLVKYLKPYKGRFLFALFNMVLVALFTGLLTWIVKKLMDDVLIHPQAGALWSVCAMILIFYFGKGLASYFSSYMMESIGIRIIRDLRNQMYEHLINQSLSYYHFHKAGHLQSRIIFDTEKIKIAVSQTVGDLLKESLTLVGLLGYIYYLDWKLALIASVLLPVAVYPVVRFSDRLRNLSLRSYEGAAELHHILGETIHAVRIVKAFCMEKFEIKRFKNALRKVLISNLHASRIISISAPMMEFIGGIGAVLVCIYASYQIELGLSTPGRFTSFLTALFFMYAPVKKLSRVNNTIQEASAASSRVFEIFQQESRINNDANAKILDKIEDAIEFRNVSFGYNGTEILKNITMKVKKGQKIAIMGPSGVGKSTLVNLLPRLYDPTDGQILIDGLDIKKLTLESLRGKIGIVTQEIILFNETIRNNIAYGLDNISDELMQKVAKTAYAHDFIMELPAGYDTPIGEWGQTLSGGQRQRIAIARAILKDPEILILDEATTSLDSESEAFIQKAISNLLEGRTAFIITHHLASLKDIDYIAILDEGTIKAIGTHEFLLENEPLYSRLYELQMLD